jgi:hypothetical protein
MRGSVGRLRGREHVHCCDRAMPKGIIHVHIDMMHLPLEVRGTAVPLATAVYESYSCRGTSYSCSSTRYIRAVLVPLPASCATAVVCVYTQLYVSKFSY